MILIVNRVVDVAILSLHYYVMLHSLRLMDGLVNVYHGNILEATTRPATQQVVGRLKILRAGGTSILSNIDPTLIAYNREAPGSISGNPSFSAFLK